MTTQDLRTALLASAALIGFAANSLLCRLALAPRLIDASTFTSVRLSSGALTLTLLVLAARGPTSPGGTWTGAAALFAYAGAFSFAYLRLGAGTGALILFGTVQATMLGWGIRTGERPHPVVWLGLGAALGGLITLTLPTLSTPDAAGTGLMVLAGIAWGIYSLRGRGGTNPLATTAGNFARAVPLAALLSTGTLPFAHASARGLALAVASGALASGVGYSLWYAALRHLTATRAAIAQLTVPMLAAAGGVVLLGERITARLLVAGAVILVGVAIALLGGARRRPAGTSPGR